MVHRLRTKKFHPYLKEFIVQGEGEVSKWAGTEGSGVYCWLV